MFALHNEHRNHYESVLCWKSLIRTTLEPEGGRQMTEMAEYTTKYISCWLSIMEVWISNFLLYMIPVASLPVHEQKIAFFRTASDVKLGRAWERLDSQSFS